MLDFLMLQTSSVNHTIITAIYTVLISFILSTMIAITYEKTFRGLSYSRNFVQAMILSSIVAATIMSAIGDSLARGLGMIGALAIIRFRTSFKDPRDIIFMFASLATGISCGVLAFSIGVIGATSFCLVAVILYKIPFGQSRFFDGLLKFNIESTKESREQLEKTLTTYCKNFALITLREAAQGDRLDYSYHIKLNPKKSSDDFVVELKKISTIRGVSLMLQETTVEI